MSFWLTARYENGETALAPLGGGERSEPCEGVF
jgi:hypothetical protein